MDKLFAEKVVVITGGTKGLGLGAARMFIMQGAYVFITGRGEGDLLEAKAELGERCFPFQCDVSSTHQLTEFYSYVESKFANIDVLLINAGINILDRMKNVSEENYDKIFSINTKGAFFSAQKALHLLHKNSSVIFVSSSAAHSAETGDGVYSGSKAALIAFAKVFSAEYAQQEIRFNVISPTMTRTPLLESLGNEAFLNYWANRHPPKRLASVDEFVGAVKFLASTDSSFVYGQDILVDGGKCGHFDFIETIENEPMTA